MRESTWPVGTHGSCVRLKGYFRVSSIANLVCITDARAVRPYWSNGIPWHCLHVYTRTFSYFFLSHECARIFTNAMRSVVVSRKVAKYRKVSATKICPYVLMSKNSVSFCVFLCAHKSPRPLRLCVRNFKRNSLTLSPRIFTYLRVCFWATNGH